MCAKKMIIERLPLFVLFNALVEYKNFDADWFEQEELVLGDYSVDYGSKDYGVDQQL